MNKPIQIYIFCDLKIKRQSFGKLSFNCFSKAILTAKKNSNLKTLGNFGNQKISKRTQKTVNIRNNKKILAKVKQLK